MAESKPPEDEHQREHPERGSALLENDKARAELFRTMGFLSTALLAGTAATVAFLLPGLRVVTLLMLSLVFNVVGITLALLGLLLATIVVGGEAYLPAPHKADSYRSLRDWIVIAAVLVFGIALVAFEVFAVVNFRTLLRYRGYRRRGLAFIHPTSGNTHSRKFA